MISLIIPTTSKNKNYTQNILNNIREIYPNENEVEVIIEENDNVTLGVNYNNAVSKANGEKIILLHNDMIIKPGFVEIMDKHIIKGRITTYTRVEPPIFPDTYPGKVLLDCGSDIDNFNSKKCILNDNINIKNINLNTIKILKNEPDEYYNSIKNDILNKKFKFICYKDSDLINYILYKIYFTNYSAHMKISFYNDIYSIYCSDNIIDIFGNFFITYIIIIFTNPSVLSSFFNI